MNNRGYGLSCLGLFAQVLLVFVISFALNAWTVYFIMLSWNLLVPVLPFGLPILSFTQVFGIYLLLLFFKKHAEPAEKKISTAGWVRDFNTILSPVLIYLLLSILVRFFM